MQQFLVVYSFDSVDLAECVLYINKWKGEKSASNFGVNWDFDGHVRLSLE